MSNTKKILVLRIAQVLCLLIVTAVMAVIVNMVFSTDSYTEFPLASSCIIPCIMGLVLAIVGFDTANREIKALKAPKQARVISPGKIKG